MQVCIKEDVRATSQAAAEAIERVAEAGNAETLDGRSAAELTEDIARNVLDQVRDRRGYLEVFRVLELRKESLIEHGLGAFPLVDLYQLDYFPVVCCEDKEEYPAWVTFYLHHGTEKTLRYTPRTGDRKTVDIQPRKGPWCGIPFRDFLERYKVPYEPDQSLGALESAMWSKLFEEPCEEFHDDQYGHSPWFDRCCREEKSVRELKKSKDWDELWVQFQPRKTTNHPVQVPQSTTGTTGTQQPPVNFGWLFLDLDSSDEPVRTPAPTRIQVTQYDWDKLGLQLLLPPVYPEEWFDPSLIDLPGFPPIHEYYDLKERSDFTHLKVMVLLKC
jgi:hypothetical protein